MSVNNTGKNLAFEGVMKGRMAELQTVKKDQNVAVSEPPAVLKKEEKSAPKTKKIRYNVLLDEDIYEYLRYESMRRGRNMTWFIHYIVRHFMDNAPEPYISDEKVRQHLSE